MAVDTQDCWRGRGTLRRRHMLHVHSRSQARGGIFRYRTCVCQARKPWKMPGVCRNNKDYCNWSFKKWNQKEKLHLRDIICQDKQSGHFLNINRAVKIEMGEKKTIISTLGYKPYHIQLLSKIKVQSSMLEQLFLLIIKMKTIQRPHY